MIHIRKPSHIRKPLNGRQLDRMIAYADDLIAVLRVAKEHPASTAATEFYIECHLRIRPIEKALARQWVPAPNAEGSSEQQEKRDVPGPTLTERSLAASMPFAPQSPPQRKSPLDGSTIIK